MKKTERRDVTLRFYAGYLAKLAKAAEEFIKGAAEEFIKGTELTKREWTEVYYALTSWEASWEARNREHDDIDDLSSPQQLETLKTLLAAEFKQHKVLSGSPQQLETLLAAVEFKRRKVLSGFYDEEPGEVERPGSETYTWAQDLERIAYKLRKILAAKNAKETR